MFARFKILLWLLCGSASIGWAASLPRVHDSVAVYLKDDAIHSAAMLQSMQVELDRIMNQVHYSVTWWSPEAKASTESQLVVIQTLGNCSPADRQEAAESPFEEVPLASTQEIDHRILPFVSLHCDRLNRFLAPSFVRNSLAMEKRYGRALARLVAHELYHFLAQTHDHTDAGVTQRGLTAVELLSSEFHFDHEASSELLTPLLVRRATPALAHESQ